LVYFLTLEEMDGCKKALPYVRRQNRLDYPFNPCFAVVMGGAFYKAKECYSSGIKKQFNNPLSFYFLHNKSKHYPLFLATLIN
jgi:hypothetical protein